MGRFAVFTIVQNENWLLDVWINHYSRLFESRDIYVLDHLLKGKACTDHLVGRCNILPIKHDYSFDHAWLKDTVTAFQKYLLASYERVVFSEVDEIITTDPALCPNLQVYLEEMQTADVRCTGYDVMQKRDEEPPIDLTKPLLSQRKWWYTVFRHCKPLITNHPIDYKVGFHEATNLVHPFADEKLVMIHLKRIDFELLKIKTFETAQRNWSEQDIINKWGFQNRFQQEEQLNEWWIEKAGPLELIPLRFRTIHLGVDN